MEIFKSLLRMTCMLGLLSSTASIAGDSYEPLDHRPLKFPELEPDHSCPVSIGHKGVVPIQQHIFGAGGHWFGKGPVYVGLMWKPSEVKEARFGLSRIPFTNDAYRAKTGWVSDPAYSGPILVQGKRLNSDNPIDLKFAAIGQSTTMMKLDAPTKRNSDFWSFWPSSMWFPGPGYYGIQIDTADSSDVIVFEVTE